MKRTFRVVTEKRFCKETGQLPCHTKPFGYVIQITPPIITFQTKDDVEGIGMVNLRSARQHTQHTYGWYKYKADALKRCTEIQTEPHQFPSMYRDDQTPP